MASDVQIIVVDAALNFFSACQKGVEMRVAASNLVNSVAYTNIIYGSLAVYVSLLSGRFDTPFDNFASDRLR